MVAQGKKAYQQRLDSLAAVLKDVESALPRTLTHDHGMAEHCDEWCKLWMLTVGSWHSLAWALHGVESSPLQESLKDAHEWALRHGIVEPDTLTPEKVNPWFAGYFLISAEHRIADTLDRLTTLFLWPNEERYVFSRCRQLAEGCPHGTSVHHPVSGASLALLQALGARPKRSEDPAFRSWLQGCAVARVWERVNTIKHKYPDSDAVAEIATRERWIDATEALEQLRN